MKDGTAKAAYVADLDGLVAQTGCTIKVPAALACVPSSKTNVTRVPPGGGGTGTPNAFGCYKLKCPKGVVPPTLTLTDQFGSRVVTPSSAKMLCAPAEPTPTTACTQPFEGLLHEAVALFDAQLPSGNFELAASCSSPTVCCPGGTPTSPCGPLHFDLVGGAILAAVPDDQMHLTFRSRLRTLTDVPINFQGAGDCGLRIDTTPSTNSGPDVQIDYTASLSADHQRVIGTSAFAISGLAAEDVTVVGGFECQTATFFLTFISDLLADQIGGALQPLQQMCRYCDGTVAACPP